MDPVVQEWLHLVIRWIHVIVGIAWIGTSFFFMWLDAHLHAPLKEEEGVEGEAWLLHSGGFYRMSKKQLAPDQIPPVLHWFKWEAYATWISGFLLMVVVYYFGSVVYLTDPEVADISKTVAIVISVGTLAVGWLVYDALWKSPIGRNHANLATVISCLLLVGAAYGLAQVFSGRAAFMHLGALLGTIMAANVFLCIIPGQKTMMAATERGEIPDPAPGYQAKHRSTHNNYMTLPVIFIMLSSHFATTFGHQYNWLIVLALFLIGAMVRHWFNLRNAGRKNVWLLPAAAVGMFALAFVASRPIAPTGANANLSDELVTFADAYAVIGKHCVSCHATKPTDEDFEVAPKKIVFETAEQIKQQAQRIKAVTVLTRTMPLGNKTKMTVAERALLGRWIDDGAEIE